MSRPKITWHRTVVEKTMSKEKLGRRTDQIPVDVLMRSLKWQQIDHKLRKESILLRVMPYNETFYLRMADEWVVLELCGVCGRGENPKTAVFLVGNTSKL